MPVEVRSLAEWEAAGIKDVLSVVIPAHNEERHIAGTVKGLVSALSAAGIKHEILVVNDNSDDDTECVLGALCRDHPGFHYTNNTPPGGYGFAVRRGLAQFRGDAVAIVMADGSDDPADLVKFYRKLQEGYPCVFGSRFSREASVSGYPVHKLVLNRLANLFIQCLFLIRYNDTTNAFKLYSRSAIAGIQPLLSSHFNLTVEMPLKCIVRGYKYAVLPNSWRNRKEGISKFKIREMGSRYLFIIFYCLIEKMLSRGDYLVADRSAQLQVWPR
jgi:dolichol-phosphate mannosyltransferase